MGQHSPHTPIRRRVRLELVSNGGSALSAHRVRALCLTQLPNSPPSAFLFSLSFLACKFLFSRSFLELYESTSTMFYNVPFFFRVFFFFS